MVEERKKQQVTIGIAVTRRNRVIVEVRTDIINHPYIQAQNV